MFWAGASPAFWEIDIIIDKGGGGEKGDGAMGTGLLGGESTGDGGAPGSGALGCECGGGYWKIEGGAAGFRLGSSVVLFATADLPSSRAYSTTNNAMYTKSATVVAREHRKPRLALSRSS